jgi:7-cyano-7-deazaguanine reductase
MTNDLKDNTSGLKSLGSKETNYQYNQPDISMLETFPNLYTDRPYIVNFDCPEYTSLCPKTKAPDFAEISIQYVPDKVCLETKSLKLYLFAFRNHNTFMETAINKIFKDIFDTVKPIHLRVKGEFNIRGGIGPTVICDSSYIPPISYLNKVEIEEDITESNNKYIQDLLDKE